MLERWLEFLTKLLAGCEIKVESVGLRFTAKGFAAVVVSLFLTWQACSALIHFVEAVGSPKASAAQAVGLIPVPGRRPDKMVIQDR
jgi:hypothetical protein